MKFSRFQLSNNIPVISIFDPDLPSITCLILIRVGSRHETDTQAGLAHFIEHMVFKGTKAYPTSQEITLSVESLGAEINAFTSYEYTGFYIKVPKLNFEKALAILAEIFLNHTLPTKEIKKEAAVIAEEIKMHDDLPAEKVRHTFFSKIFAKHPLGREIAGTVKSVSTFKRPDFEDFIKANYVAENMVVVVSGSFVEERLPVLLENNFAGIKHGQKALPKEFIKIVTPSSEIIWEKRDITQQHLILGGFSYPKDVPEKYALQTGNSILAWGMGSLLHQTIRENLGLAYYVSLGNRAFTEVGAFAASMGIHPKNIQKAITAFFAVMKRFLNGDFSDRDLERGKNYLIGNLIHNLETSEDLAEWYGLQYLLNNKIETQEEIITKIKALTKVEIISVWQKIISKDNLLISLLGPAKEQTIKISL